MSTVFDRTGRDDSQIPRTYISAPWPRKPSVAVLLIPPYAQLAPNAGVPTCMVRAIVNDSIVGTPVQGATVEYVLSGYDVDDGYVAPLKVTVYTDEFGEAFINLWPNELGAVETVYNVKIIANGKTLRLTCAVPNTPEADLHLIAQLPPWPGQSQGAFLSGEVYDWMLRAEEAAQAAEQSKNETAAIADAVGLDGAEVDPSGHLIVTRGDGTEYDAGYVMGATGPEGPQGPSGSASAGTTLDKQVLFNDANVVAGSNNFSWIKANNLLVLGTPQPFAAGLEVRNGTVAQATRIYSTYTDSSNYERMKVGWNGNVMELGSEVAGTGVGRSLKILSQSSVSVQSPVSNGVKFNLAYTATTSYADIYKNNDGGGNSEYLRVGAAGTGFTVWSYAAGTGVAQSLSIGTNASAPLYFAVGGTTRWAIDPTTGHLTPYATDSYNLGASNPRIAGIFARDVNCTNITGNQIGVVTLASNTTIIGASGVAAGVAAGGIFFSCSGIRHANIAFLPNEREFLVNGGVNSVATTDTYGINLALRGVASANSQFRVYNVGGFTDTSNYERMWMGWSANEMRIGLEAVGTGVTSRAMGILTSRIWFRDPTNSGIAGFHMDLANKRWDIYNTYDGGANYERFGIYWSGSALYMATQAGGTGVARNIRLQSGALLYLGSSAGDRWQLDTNGHLVPMTTATYNIGQTTLRIATVYGGSQNLTGQITLDGGISAGWNAGTPVAGNVGSFTPGGNIKSHLSITGIGIASDCSLWWSSSANSTGTADVILVRDAANAAAMRNGVTQQRFSVYNTYTDASNYEKGNLMWSGNVLQLQTSQLGTGVARAIKIDAGTTITLAQAGTTRWFMDANGHWTAPTDNTLDIGLTSSQRPRIGYFATGVFTATMVVASLPAAGSTTQSLRCFVNDSTVVAAGNFGNVVVGGGANKVPVYCDGAAWRIG